MMHKEEYFDSYTCDNHVSEGIHAIPHPNQHAKTYLQHSEGNTPKAWQYESWKNPYPMKEEKIMLAIITKMTLTQVSTWFSNIQQWLKKENKMTWSPSNQCREG